MLARTRSPWVTLQDKRTGLVVKWKRLRGVMYATVQMGTDGPFVEVAEYNLSTAHPRAIAETLGSRERLIRILRDAHREDLIK